MSLDSRAWWACSFGLAVVLTAASSNAARHFEQPFLYSDPSDVSALGVAGDVDLDGKLDLILWNSNAAVLHGDGAANFTQVQSFPAPSDMTLGDVTGDTYPDLVGPSLVKLNNGDGTFGPELSISGSGNYVHLRDLNGDGKLDMVYADTGIRARLGNGDGTFGAFTFPFTTAGTPARLVMADVNGDGKPDALVPCGGSPGVVSVFLGTGNASLFQARVDFNSGSGARCVAVGDLNEDGNADLAVGGFDGSVFSGNIHLGNGNGTFGAGASLSTVSAHETAIADFNGDANLDVVFGNGASGFKSVEVFPGNGNGTFGAKTTWDLQGAGPLRSLQVDAGPTWDLIAGDGLLLGNGDGTFGRVRRASTNTTPHRVVLGDMNNDGALDAISANFGSASVTVALGNGDGTFGSTASYGTGISPESVGLADFDHNGRLDIATANLTGSVSILLALPGGGFAPKSDIALPTPVPQDLVARDTDGDGHADLVVGRFSGCGVFCVSGLVTVYKGVGNGTFTFFSDYAISNTGFFGVALADMNGDGKLDLVTGNRRETSCGVSVWPGDGTGGYLSPTSYNSGSIGQTSPVLIADFNLDGKLDVVNNSRLFFGNGNGTLATPSLSIPDTRAVGDLDADSKPDLVQTGNASWVGVWFGDGTGAFPRWEYLGAGTSTYGAAIGYMDAGLTRDLVVTNSSGNNLTTLLNTTSVVGVEPPASGALALRGHPNPAVSGYRLSFHLPRTSPVTFRIFDASGRRVKTVALGSLAAGPHTVNWDMTDERGGRVSAGLYFCEIRTADETRRTRLAVLR